MKPLQVELPFALGLVRARTEATARRTSRVVYDEEPSDDELSLIERQDDPWFATEGVYSLLLCNAETVERVRRLQGR